jgi:hypothetical protein
MRPNFHILGEECGESFMSVEIEKALLESYSRGELTRREIEERMNQEISFGALLGELHKHGLPLPRVPSDPQSPGVRLIKELAERAAPRGR